MTLNSPTAVNGLKLSILADVRAFYEYDKTFDDGILYLLHLRYVHLGFRMMSHDRRRTKLALQSQIRFFQGRALSFICPFVYIMRMKLIDLIYSLSVFSFFSKKHTSPLLH